MRQSRAAKKQLRSSPSEARFEEPSSRSEVRASISNSYRTLRSTELASQVRSSATFENRARSTLTASDMRNPQLCFTCDSTHPSHGSRTFQASNETFNPV